MWNGCIKGTLKGNVQWSQLLILFFLTLAFERDVCTLRKQVAEKNIKSIKQNGLLFPGLANNTSKQISDKWSGQKRQEKISGNIIWSARMLKLTWIKSCYKSTWLGAGHTILGSKCTVSSQRRCVGSRKNTQA